MGSRHCLEVPPTHQIQTLPRLGRPKWLSDVNDIEHDNIWRATCVSNSTRGSRQFGFGLNGPVGRDGCQVLDMVSCCPHMVPFAACSYNRWYNLRYKVVHTQLRWLPGGPRECQPGLRLGFTHLHHLPTLPSSTTIQSKPSIKCH